MSKLAVFVGVPTAAAVVGLAIWNVQLQGEIENLRAATHAVSEVGGQPAGGAVGSGERSEDRSGARAGSRREEARTRAFDDRLRVLEERLAAAPAESPAAASAGDDLPALSADLPEMLRHADFGRAVNEVIDARDEARRQERIERDAEQRTRRMLRELDVTDAQREDVLRVTHAFLQRRDEMRRAAGDADDDADREARREAGRAVESEWHEALAGILDATQMETVKQRTTERRSDPRRPAARPRRGGGSRGGGGLR